MSSGTLNPTQYTLTHSLRQTLLAHFTNDAETCRKQIPSTLFSPIRITAATLRSALNGKLKWSSTDYQYIRSFLYSRCDTNLCQLPPYLTLSLPIPLRLCTLPYWSNQPSLIFDIWALWRSLLSARAPKCQKLKMVG